MVVIRLQEGRDLKLREFTMSDLAGTLVVSFDGGRRPVQRIAHPVHRLSLKVLRRVWYLIIAEQRTSTHTCRALISLENC